MNLPTSPFRLLPPQRVVGSEQVAPLQFKIEDTARLLSVSRRTIERLIERGELATVGANKLKRIPYDSILAYQNRHRSSGVN
jgi:excisionase family DNA binding protein